MNRINCIICKIISIIGVFASIAFTPFQFIYCGLEFNYVNLIVMIIVSCIFFLPTFLMLIKTNNPISRYNIFTVNPKWTGKMKGSMQENPSQLFEFDEPDKSDIRNKKINEILK